MLTCPKYDIVIRTQHKCQNIVKVIKKKNIQINIKDKKNQLNQKTVDTQTDLIVSVFKRQKNKSY